MPLVFLPCEARNYLKPPSRLFCDVADVAGPESVWFKWLNFLIFVFISFNFFCFYSVHHVGMVALENKILIIIPPNVRRLLPMDN